MKWSEYYTKYGIITITIIVAIFFLLTVKLYCHCDLIDPALAQENIARQYEEPKTELDWEAPRMSERERIEQELKESYDNLMDKLALMDEIDA